VGDKVEEGSVGGLEVVVLDVGSLVGGGSTEEVLDGGGGSVVEEGVGGSEEGTGGEMVLLATLSELGSGDGGCSDGDGDGGGEGDGDGWGGWEGSWDIAEEDMMSKKMVSSQRRPSCPKGCAVRRVRVESGRHKKKMW
jgi:hypothetical protein